MIKNDNASPDAGFRVEGIRRHEDIRADILIALCSAPAALENTPRSIVNHAYEIADIFLADLEGRKP